MRFAFYGRVSTEDAQDPDASLGWQVRRATGLIEPAGGVIVAQYFDVGQSRSVPWRRRPEASRLLAALKDSERGFSAVVIGEPQRAFYGPQFALTFPVLTHYGVGLWVPEVGGAVDPGSDAHDMVMTLFGGMSKSERARIQVRVRTAMYDLAERTDRFLGGRPPYGYRLADSGPHPNPSKAAAGQRLHRLEPDPLTAPVVERIFIMFGIEQRGFRTIAELLTAEGVPSPAAHDRARNRHRNPLGWSHSAVRAILANPTYRGTRVWGKQGRVETLIDPDDPAAGHQTRMRWHDRSDWVRPAGATHEALVPDELADLVAARIDASGTPRRKPRTSPHPYCLRGLLVCGRCGTRMQGSWRPDRHGGPGRILYRCEARRSRALPPELADHPPTLYVREDAILRHLDPWIESLADPAWLSEADEDHAADRAESADLRAQLGRLEAKIANLMDAIEAGGDTTVLMERLTARNAERDALRHQIALLTGRARLSPVNVAALIDELGGIAAVLGKASANEKLAIYDTLGLQLVYDDVNRQVRATANLARVASRVGGGT